MDITATQNDVTATPKERNAVSQQTVGSVHVDNPRMQAKNVQVFYGDKHAIQDVTIDIGSNEVIAFIGPSGCGKSTFLRCLNRMNDTIDICNVQGEITLDGKNIYDPSVDVVPLRARLVWSSKSPTRFPRASTTTWLTAHASTVWLNPRPNWTRWSKHHSAAPACGMRSKIDSISRYRAVGWSTATFVYCSCDRGQPRSDSDGRTLFGIGPDCDRSYRRVDS